MFPIGSMLSLAAVETFAVSQWQIGTNACQSPKPIGRERAMGARNANLSADGRAETKKSARSRLFSGRLCAVAVLAFALGASAAHGDAITDWDVVAFDTFKAANVGGNPLFRALAIMHVAMSDAVNTVQNRYMRYALTVPMNTAASADAAATAAARSVLVTLAPSQRAKVDESYVAALGRLPDGPGKAAGVTIGEQAAAVVIAERADDATNVPDTYRPVTAPGVWVPTSPPLFAEYARAKPWVFARADQFRPGPPPELISAVYARDYNETKELGGAKTARRTPEQTM